MTGGYHLLLDFQPRQRRKCSWCERRRMCWPGRWTARPFGGDEHEVWCCEDCLTPAQRRRRDGRAPKRFGGGTLRSVPPATQEGQPGLAGDASV